MVYSSQYEVLCVIAVYDQDDNMSYTWPPLTTKYKHYTLAMRWILHGGQDHHSGDIVPRFVYSDYKSGLPKPFDLISWTHSMKYSLLLRMSLDNFDTGCPKSKVTILIFYNFLMKEVV